MAAHPDLPTNKETPRAVIHKTLLLDSLKKVDDDQVSRERVLEMETVFRKQIAAHVGSLPLASASFDEFNTNPYVLLFQALKEKYSDIRQIEKDILPAKIFASMETSAGKMVERVVIPKYGWSAVPSSMHSPNSVLDAMKRNKRTLHLATLKSGPACLNDPTSKDIATDIVSHCVTWAKAAKVNSIDFTYGVLYGTKRMSNKKDWHILRQVAEQITKLPGTQLIDSPRKRWRCRFQKDDITVELTVRIGIELYNHLAGHDLAFVEIATALIRACVTAGELNQLPTEFTIRDLGAIVSLDAVPPEYNVALLQHNQWEWLFFFARHFCDRLEDAP